MTELDSTVVIPQNGHAVLMNDKAAQTVMPEPLCHYYNFSIKYFSDTSVGCILPTEICLS